MKAAPPPFPQVVADAMTRRGLGLRELCRRAEVDPSLMSKVLAGKRNPPSEEAPLRRLAEALELDPVELIVAAGRIPGEWGALRTDPDLVKAVNAIAAGRPIPSRRPDVRGVPPRRDLSEELL